MNRMRVKTKICGVTSVDDAIAIANAGADAIGLVFYPPSPRYVSTELAHEISLALPAFVNVVGLFVDADSEMISRVLDKVAIDTVQFHGQEPEEACSQYGKPYIKAIAVQPGTDILGFVEQYSSASALLLDTYVDNLPGGTGRKFDWKKVPENCEKPLILAGGLTPENVQSAIEQTNPYAVDVSGGVESSKGKKDIDKVTRFIREVANVRSH